MQIPDLMGPPAHGRRLGPYALVKKIAAGGMGEIYLAHDTRGAHPSKQVAIKVLRREFSADKQVLQMFINEAKLAGSLMHESIVRVFDVGQARGRFYIAMEYVEGVSGATLVKSVAGRRERLTGDLLCLIGQKLCAGLQHAHGQRGADGRSLHLVHRDVNPRNVMASSRGEVKLTDFGIAKASNVETHTRKGTVKGTLEYLAPEQVRGKAADARVDVYGAGITLYYLATMDSPFWRGSVGATLDAIQNSPLPSLQILRPDLSGPLMRAIEQATDKSPQTRFQTAIDFAYALPQPTSEATERLGELVRTCTEEQFDARPDTEDLSLAVKSKSWRRVGRLTLNSLPTIVRPQLVDDNDIIEDLTSPTSGPEQLLDDDAFDDEAFDDARREGGAGEDPAEFDDDEGDATAAATYDPRRHRRWFALSAGLAVCAALTLVVAPRLRLGSKAGGPSGCDLIACDTFARASFVTPCEVAKSAAPEPLCRLGAVCMSDGASVPPIPPRLVTCAPKRASSRGKPVLVHQVKPKHGLGLHSAGVPWALRR